MILKQDINTLRIMSGLFSAAFFRKVVVEDNFSYAQKKIKRHLAVQKSITLNQIIKEVYSELEAEYRNEYVYKNTILNNLILRKYSLKNTVVLNEFRIGNSIADLVLLNGEVKVFEIKTDLDGLEKLDKQITDYLKFANKIYIVVSQKNVQKLLERYCDSTIGIIEFTSLKTLKTRKEAQNDGTKFDHSVIFKTLRKNEYSEIVNDYFHSVPKVPNTQFFRECLKMTQKIDVYKFQQLALDKLKFRNLNCPSVLSSRQTPFELKHICNTLNFNKKEYSCLFSALNKYI